MAAAQYGDRLLIHYTGKYTDGRVFTSSLEHGPVRVTIGEGRLLPALELAMVGMQPGESKTVQLSSDEAYGPIRQDLIVVRDRRELPEDFKPKIGQRVNANGPGGARMQFRVVFASKSAVTLDGNHPLAGRDLVFDVRLITIEKKAKQAEGDG